MPGYRLQTDELLLYRAENIAHAPMLENFSHDLILTDKNLVLSVRNWRGRVSKNLIFPLSKISQFNGKPETRVQKGSEVTRLKINFPGSSQTFGFRDAHDAVEFDRRIYEILTGITLDPPEENTLMFSVDKLPDTLRQTAKMFQSVLGLTKPAAPKPKPTPVKATGDCESCGAPISGYRGRRILCEYCDVSTIL